MSYSEMFYFLLSIRRRGIFFCAPAFYSRSTLFAVWYPIRVIFFRSFSRSCSLWAVHTHIQCVALMIFAEEKLVAKSFLYFPLLCIQSELCILISLAVVWRLYHGVRHLTSLFNVGIVFLWKVGNFFNIWWWCVLFFFLDFTSRECLLVWNWFRGLFLHPSILFVSKRLTLIECHGISWYGF